MAVVIGVVVGLHVEIHEATLEAIHLGFTNGSLTIDPFLPGPDQPPQHAAARRHQGQPLSAGHAGARGARPSAAD